MKRLHVKRKGRSYLVNCPSDPGPGEGVHPEYVPIFVLQPSNFSGSIGGSAVFSSSAIPWSDQMWLHYQWYSGSVALTEGGQFTGSQTPYLRITTLTAANTGSYYVSAINVCNVDVTSSNVVLTV